MCQTSPVHVAKSSRSMIRRQLLSAIAATSTLVGGGLSILTPRSYATSVRIQRTLTRKSAATSARVSSTTLATFSCIARYESGNRNTPERYGQSGYYQIADVSLHSIGHLPGTASAYSKAVQLRVAEQIEAVQGWHRAFPITSRLCGR